MHTAKLNQKDNDMLGYSNISYYSSSYTADGTRLVSATKELKDFYKGLTKYIKGNSKICFPHYKRKIWLGNNAHKSVLSGILLQDVQSDVLEMIYEN